MIRFPLFIAAATLLSASAVAQQPPMPTPPAMPDPGQVPVPPPAPIPPPPPILDELPPDIPEQATQLAPDDVRIIQTPKGAVRVEEFKKNGQTWMVRIIPSFGPPYYLVDTDGDGELDARKEMPGIGVGVKPTMWNIFSW